ncbi:mannose-1-phosphate guanylyltransferase [Spirochaetia bacterium]|nr:mannose-1-phosphate guanylyltransferase [Spirochaetia bacterium]
MSGIDLTQFIVSEDMLIIDAMAIINRNARGIVFICKDTVVLATLTDGDIRRHILAGKSLTASVSEAAHYNFNALPAASSYTEIEAFCDKLSINIVPGVDQNGKLITIFFKDGKDKINDIKKIDVPVVIMAGGKGTRLYPYTKILPKPLIPIGDSTITEHIMEKFIDFGCNEFTMIVNHKKEMIKAYFSEIDTSEISIEFLDENEFRGTGGGLSLLKSLISETFFFSNCDILVLGDYYDMYEQHKNSGNLLTMVCATKSFSFPYGTVDVGEDGKIRSLLEKPSYSFLTNTGFYIIEPEFLKFVPDNIFIHITDIIQNCINQGNGIGVYPVSENQWFDMGNHEDMEKMVNKVTLAEI